MATDPTTAPRIDQRSAGFEWRDVPADQPLRRLTRDEMKAFDCDGFVIVLGVHPRRTCQGRSCDRSDRTDADSAKLEQL
jgi:hypothetical protein